MATLIKADGTRQDVTPADGREFSLSEMQGFVGGYIEMVPAREPGLVLVVNEDGLGLQLPHNAQASADKRPDVLGYIVGDALLCTQREAGFGS